MDTNPFTAPETVPAQPVYVTPTATPAARHTADRAAYLITSDDPAEVTAGLRLAFALPKELRTAVMEAIEYYLPTDDTDPDSAPGGPDAE